MGPSVANPTPLTIRMHDDREAEPAASAGRDDAAALAGEIANVQRAAGHLRMAEAVLDQVALHLVEMESYFPSAPTHSADHDWRRQGIASSIRQIQAVCDMARVNGCKLFGGIGAIAAKAAGMDASLELPPLEAGTLGDPRAGMISTLVEFPSTGREIIATAQAQVAAQKARVCECAAKIGEMIQTLQISLEMHAAAGTTLGDDEFARAVAQTSQIDVFLAAKIPALPFTSGPTMLRIRRQPRD